MLPETVNQVASVLLRGRTVAFGLSVFLFTFMLLPTLLVLMAVVILFLFSYPRLRKADVPGWEQGRSPRTFERTETPR